MGFLGFEFDCTLYKYLTEIERTKLIDILATYYLTLLQLAVAFTTVSSIFGLFRMQSISEDLTKAYNAFRNWILYRFNKVYGPNEFNEADYLKNTIGVDKEPDSWLEKDIFDHLEAYKNKNEEAKGHYTKALTDYFNYIYSRIAFRKRLFYLIFTPFFIFALISLFSLFMILEIKLFNFQIPFVLFMTRFLSTAFIIAFLTLLYSVWYSLRDLSHMDVNINNPKTNWR